MGFKQHMTEIQDAMAMVDSSAQTSRGEASGQYKWAKLLDAVKYPGIGQGTRRGRLVS
jgi:hypothetical protein